MRPDPPSLPLRVEPAHFTDSSLLLAACGTFYNKNGYHRNKPGTNGAAAETSPPRLAPSSSTAPRGGRPLQGRLTATCEADLQRKVKKHKAAAGVIPPLSPSKHVGPRSPALKFDFGGGHRSVGRSVGVAMSSPGRSPRLRYRTTVVPYPATSPLRGSASASTARAAAAATKDGAVDYESDGEERGPNPLSFGNLFGLNGSPSPVRIEQRPGSGGKGMPSYLLSASPGTALDRILNDTNIGSIGGMACAGGSGAVPASDAMQLEEAAAATLDDDFAFFLQPGSPTRGNKENARPRAGTASATDGAPATDLESSFESVLSSLRRDFNTRLSSNALTAPSSPAPSSPCVLPRTSTATPGSKGKAPQSGGREPPSILDGFMDSLVPGLILDPEVSGASAVRQHMGLTPASDSDAWSPADAYAVQHDADRNHDQTLTLDSFAGTSATKSRPPRSSAQQHHLEHDKARPSASKNINRRAPFIPAHLLAPSDATEYDYGSLPPSSPPQLPSEAFPTPSDFDGITPSADGGDNDEQRAHVGAGAAGADGVEPLSLEAVAAHVAREPDADARKGMIALLQSLGGGATGVSEPLHLPGTGSDQIQLDRGTVNRLLALISAKSPAGEAPADDVSPTPAGEPAAAHLAPTATSSASREKRSAATTKATAPPVAAHEQAHPAPDLSHFDFEAFATGSGDAPTAAAAQSFGAGGQLSELYADLFSGASGF